LANRPKTVSASSASLRSACESEDVPNILDMMGQNQIVRMLAVNNQCQLISILSIGNIAAKDPDGGSRAAYSPTAMLSSARPDRANA